MSVPYYLGAKAIADRLGYKSTRIVHTLIVREGLPVYKRSKVHRTGACKTLAISESAITAWELSKGQQFVSRKRSQAANKTDIRMTALKHSKAS